MRILFVSAPHPEAAWLHKAFREGAHSLQRAENSRDGVFLATSEPFDAVIALALDEDAQAELFDALPSLSSAPNAPAIIVLGRGLGADGRVAMLRAGADACFTQPYSFTEIHERIIALHRTAAVNHAGAATEDRSAICLDAATRELVGGAARLALTKREYQLLECLLRQPDMPVPRDQLIRYAWAEREDVDPSSVNLVVSRLRQKLADRLPHVHIETVSRYGYRLSATHGR